MQYKYRKVKNASGNIGVQVGFYRKGNFKVHKHLGTAHNQEELSGLIQIATQDVNKLNSTHKQLLLFKEQEADLQKEFFDKYRPLEVKHYFAYQTLERYFNMMGYTHIKSNLLKDLALIRIIKATSKRESLHLLKEYFNISYSESLLYKRFGKMQRFKREVEKLNTKFAIDKLKQDLTIMFYDVTTLYFESFKSDKLKNLGFSKDNKFSQPQLVIGLVTTSNGFPLTYHLYQGKKFEGHTMIPTIRKYLKKKRKESITVVADAGMLSKDNIKSLTELGWRYIVGARLSNLRNSYFVKIKEHDFVKNSYLEINTHMGRLVIVFSEKRYKKDSYELEKRIEKAEQLIKSPSKISSRYKYIKKSSKEKYTLNNDLITKRRELLGLRGYYTNTNYSLERIISEYKNLWRIEQNFRVLKSDLVCRPIYHWKPANIQSHLLVAFMALSVSKHVEISKGQSIKSYVGEIMRVKTLELEHLETDQILRIRI